MRRGLASVLSLVVSALCLTADEIEAQRSGWNLNPNTQYHIQTDEGPERFFRFQTSNGQYRKEKRLADGTVIGTEGWLDPLGYLRLKDYIADHEGFRILRSKMVYVGKDRPIQDAVAETKKVPAQTGVLARPRRPPNPFRRPDPNAVVPLSGNDITSGYYTPTTIRPRPISRNNYYSSRSGYPSSGLQSLDGFHRPQVAYYRGSAIRPPTQILEAPYDSAIGGSSIRPSYQLPISRNDPGDLPPYDGTHTTANGFQYYLRRQYHEEEREPEGNNVGSFGYIDPFGIRRVIYYKTDPFTGGFLHKKNNRYVGFNATPYDPLPPDLSRTRLSRAPPTSAS
ncbi:PREDICTED: uncharacterized protein LOC105457813 isoform X2 [Wasmannia auropunctata]|uniref:uncharacterized protein LOC105457813 isoform X2 n=1 Tax=Wasmannia auropunctata TaxID=64793 RepID=UPI0005EE240B|nr:PREDICTED: uncharacterized protein LOC105457813 isoform X2 [Wasmannia auropunctata]